ncbi:PEMT methyltransferase, partial [Polyodon spathula]|nr:PEMT methyltransferase [Polyodon spathula]
MNSNAFLELSRTHFFFITKRINNNTAAQREQTLRLERELRESGWAPLERREREPAELELLLQKWEQAENVLSAMPAREVLESPAPEELMQGEQEEETVLEPEEVSTAPPPQLQPITPEKDPALLRLVSCPLLLDTLQVFLDLPALGLEPRSDCDGDCLRLHGEGEWCLLSNRLSPSECPLERYHLSGDHLPPLRGVCASVPVVGEGRPSSLHMACEILMRECGKVAGDHFGILKKEKVTGFPFNVMDNPMYWGSTANYLGITIM